MTNSNPLKRTMRAIGLGKWWPFVALLIAIFLGSGIKLPVLLERVAGIARGNATVIDGDTIMIAGLKELIRLFGIDAPEWKQYCTENRKRWACGKEAKYQLESVVAGENIRCQQEDIDTYGRIVGTCYTLNGLDLNKWMVSHGWAVAYQHYSVRYVAAENTTKSEN